MDFLKDIQRLLREYRTPFDVDWHAYGRVNIKVKDDLVLFNYMAECNFDDDWTPFELMSRGLIMNWETGRVVARPFDKFFNWGQSGRYSNAPVRCVYTKYDGSMSSIYYHNGQWHAATRGSFDGDQALWATNYLRDRDTSFLDSNNTYIAEVIYPENRIVVDYGGTNTLVILAIRNRDTGKYLWPNEHGGWPILQSDFEVPLFTMPGILQLDPTDPSPERIVERVRELGPNEEGYVAWFEDGQIFKFKGEQYLELHRIVTGLNFNRVLEAYKEGRIPELISALPDEFAQQVWDWFVEIQERVNEIVSEAETAWLFRPRKDDGDGARKENALWIRAEHAPLQKYLFAKLSGKDYRDIILKQEFGK